VSHRIVHLPAVFKPRSDTWMLADELLSELRPGATVLDVCTGSGAIAVTAARAGGDVTAVDVSRRAVASARLNAALHRVRVRAVRGDLFGPVADRRFDFVVSNPPYLPGPDDSLPRRGPARAWEGGVRGRLLLDRICSEASAHLNPGGSLMLVHSSLTGTEETLERLRAAGLAADVVARRRGPLGPLMLERAEALERRGLLEPGDRTEELVVIRARA
jgi:release factor glutamine methyltransferase